MAVCMRMVLGLLEGLHYSTDIICVSRSTYSSVRKLRHIKESLNQSITEAGFVHDVLYVLHLYRSDLFFFVFTEVSARGSAPLPPFG